MFYGKATSEYYTDFQTGFYPRIIMYEYTPSNYTYGCAYGFRHNTILDTDLPLYASDANGSSMMFSYIKFSSSKISIKIMNQAFPVHFTIFG